MIRSLSTRLAVAAFAAAVPATQLAAQGYQSAQGHEIVGPQLPTARAKQVSNTTRAAAQAASAQAAGGGAPNAKTRMNWVDSYEDALAQAKRDDDFVLVDFYTNWCGWCKRLDKDVFAKDSFLEAASGVVGVKVNAEKHRALANHFGATSYPRLFFLDSQGKTLEQIRGYLSLQDFTAKVKAVKAGDTQYARLRQSASDPTNLGAIRSFARFLSDTGRGDDSIAYWQQAHDLALERMFNTPNANGNAGQYHCESLLELGRAYMKVGLSEVAVQHLDEVRSACEGTCHAADAAYALADVHIAKGENQVAGELYREIVRTAPRCRTARLASRGLQKLSRAAQAGAGQ